jgi:deoxyribonuclease V
MPIIQHDWNLSAKEAIILQKQLSQEIILDDRFGEITCVAGIDVGFEESGAVTRAAVCLLDFPSLEPREQAISRRPTTFPYIPGLLSFREAPAVLQALLTLKHKPNLLLCDGQGYAHPRRFGIACHLGLLTDTPSIGVGKSRLTGRFEPPGLEKGDWTPLIDRDETIGAVLRSRNNVSPIYISSGHRISLPSALRFVMACLTRYRLPETTRCAHKLASG